MKLAYTYTFAEYQAINRARRHFRRFAGLHNWLFWGLVLANVAVSLSYFYLYYQQQLLFSWLIFANLFVAILVLAYRFVFLPLRRRHYYKAQMLEGKNIGVRVSEQGIETIAENTKTRFDWKGFIKLSEEPEHFIMWINKLQAICIPKRSFADRQQMDEFRKKIARNIDNHPSGE